MTPNRKFRIHSILVLSIFVFLFALAACEKPSTGYKFHGKLDPSDTGYLYLTYDTFSIGNIPTPFDTAIIKGGSFEFTGRVANPMPCIVTRSNGEAIAVFILENSDITMDTLTNQFGFVVTGSTSQREAEELDEMWISYIENLDTNLDSLAGAPGISPARHDSLLVESRKFDSLAEVAYYKNLTAYVKAHSTSYGALYGWQLPDLWDEGSVEPARRVLEQFDPTLRKSPQGKYLQRQIDYYQTLQAGQLAPDLNLKDGEGKIVSLSTYKGKRVVLFTIAYWDLREQDFKDLSKLKNTVIIANSPHESWSRLNCVKVYSDEETQSSYLPLSEAAPFVFVIDENGRLVSKGFDSWKDLR
jgi:hypothetical protein